MDALLERQQSEFPRGGFPRSNPIAVAVAAVYDRRVENDFGAHRAPLQEEQSVVAAVCDRRRGVDRGSHRQPPQPVKK